LAAIDLKITEADPSGSGNAGYKADWFEVTNTGTTAVDITGWKMDDNSHASATAVALRGLTSIAPGQTVVFIEGLADGSTDASILANFSTAWFGSATLPAGFIYGFYGGTGVGLSGTADEVNLFDASGNWITGIGFGAATAPVTTIAPATPGKTFDNKTGVSLSALAATSPLVSTLSEVGTNGAFLAADGLDIGSPGKIANATPVTPAVNLSISSNAGSETARSVITVTATAASAVASNQTVNLAVTGTGITTGDYTLGSSTITIPSGATSGSTTFTIVDDTAVEGNETAILTISSPSAGISLGSNVAQNIVISDNDTAPKNNTSIDLSKYVQVGRYDLPEPSHPGTVTPTGSLLAQEVSAVTYDWDTDTLFVVGDGSTSIVQVNKKGELIDSMTLAPDPTKPQGTSFYDVEGLTYVGGGKFVLQEERYRQANLFTYVPNATLYSDKTVDAAGKTLASGGVQTVKLGTTVGNIGNEGITYDPFSSGFVLVKESGPEGIFQTTIDFANGTASNGSPTTVNSVDLFNPALLGLADLADVFSVSTLSSQIGKDDYDHLIVLSQESGKIVNIDRTGKIYSTLTIDAAANGLTTPQTSATPINVVDQSHEGITMDKDGFLYVTSENGGGDITRPQLWVYAPSTVAPNPNPAVNLSVSSNTGSEAAKSVITVTATAASAVASNQTVNLAVTGSGITTGDYALVSQTITIPTGATSGSTTFTIVDDTAVEGTETATLTISSPSAGISLGSATTQNIVITDNDVAPPTAPPTISITEVSPWSSGNSAYKADWFELTNTGTTAVDITGWKIDDNSNSFASAVALRGVSSIAPGKSVVFIEGLTDGSTDAAIDASFSTTWFGTATPPADVTIGNYGGASVGLSTGGDAVNIFDATGKLVTGISFGDSTTSTYLSFDNAAGLGSSTLPTPTVTGLSAVGVNGGFLSFDGKETGSPGKIAIIPNPPIVGTTGADNLVGTAGDDIIDGGAGNDIIFAFDGNDIIYGGAGVDLLYSGTGNDIFAFNNASQGIDKIFDFGTGNDRIGIDRAGFGGNAVFGSDSAIGLALDPSRFTLGSSATTASQRFIYNDQSGALFFDTDGAGGANQVRIAQLVGNPTLSSSSFVTI
jgi:uncharacterized protein YjiK